MPALPDVNDTVMRIGELPESSLEEVSREVKLYEEDEKRYLERLSSAEASNKAIEIINSVTAFYDQLFQSAKLGGYDESVLTQINVHIKDDVNFLLREFTPYIENDDKVLQMLILLLDSRVNKAIKERILISSFNRSMLVRASPSLVSRLIAQFWDCYLPIDQESEWPDYTTRLIKIFPEQMYVTNTNGEYLWPEYVALFEHHSTMIAAQSNDEKRATMNRHLEIARRR